MNLAQCVTLWRVYCLANLRASSLIMVFVLSISSIPSAQDSGISTHLARDISATCNAESWNARLSRSTPTKIDFIGTRGGAQKCYSGRATHEKCLPGTRSTRANFYSSILNTRRTQTVGRQLAETLKELVLNTQRNQNNAKSPDGGRQHAEICRDS